MRLMATAIAHSHAVGPVDVALGDPYLERLAGILNRVAVDPVPRARVPHRDLPLLVA
jgi:hypothetical protein